MEQLNFAKFFPNLKKLEIIGGYGGMLDTMKPENPATNLALNKGMYDEEFKASIRGSYVNLPGDWLCKARDSTRGKFQVTHSFEYYRRTLSAEETSYNGGSVVGFYPEESIEVMILTMRRRLNLTTTQ